MHKQLGLFSVLVFIVSCGQSHKSVIVQKDTLIFKTSISPAFIETAEVTLTKIDSEQIVQFLLKDAYGNDKPSDTFYLKSVVLTSSQFHKIDSEVLYKIITGHSVQKNGVRDGFSISFSLIHKADTTLLSFDNPDSILDTAAFDLTKNTFNSFNLLFKDTIIREYLSEIETYIDPTKKDSLFIRERAINKLRKLKYNLH